jgi:raffinose/stachyose/melibiose transport system substrate-binding protein
MKKNIAFLLVAALAITSAFANGKSEETASSAKEPAASITFLNSKGEVQVALEDLAKAYEKQTGNHVEIIACGTGEVPYTKVTTMYNSGNAPTISMLDQTDVYSLYKDYAVDLSNEKWVAQTNGSALTIDGKVYGFPFCIEGRGIIYNGAAIDKTLKHHVDLGTINSYSSFKSLLEQLRAAGMKNPVFLAKEDWSLGAHQLGFIYDTYDGTTAGSAKIINQLENGLDPLTYDRFNEFIKTFDLLSQYNYYQADPLGADYDEGAMLLADGTVAFWPNGSWAWPNLAEGGATTDQDFGFIPFFLGDDTSDFANTGIEAAATKVLMLDKVQASAGQQQAAKDFLNWLVFDPTAQKLLVTDANIIPAAKNNPNKPLDPLGQNIVTRMAGGKTYPSCFIAPSDHWSVIGAAMQKYLAGKSSKDDLAKSLSAYWVAQKTK